MRYPLHRHIGRSDDRDVPTRRQHDPRSGQAPLGGLDHDPTFYSQRRVEDGPVTWEEPDSARDGVQPVPRTVRPLPEGERSPVRPRVRSDDDIYESLWDALDADPDLDSSRINAFVEDGEVRLRGFVDDVDIRRRVEELVLGVSGVSDVVNALRIRH